MATPRKRTAKVKTVADENYSKLDQYCIWLNEYYKALIRAGFKSDIAMTVMMNPETYPEWVNGVSPEDVRKHIEEEDE